MERGFGLVDDLCGVGGWARIGPGGVDGGGVERAFVSGGGKVVGEEGGRVDAGVGSCCVAAGVSVYYFHDRA